MTPNPPPADSALINVAFSLSSPGARSVTVAIFFDRWTGRLPTAEPEGDGGSPYRNHQMVRDLVRLKQVKSGHWHVETPLAPGWHEYLFLVDGAWTMDPEAANVCPNDAGGFSAVRIVSAVEAPNVIHRQTTQTRRPSRQSALRRAS